MSPEIEVEETTGYSKVEVLGHQLYLMPAIHRPGRKHPDCAFCFFDKREYEVQTSDGNVLCGVLYHKDETARVTLCYEDMQTHETKVYIHPRQMTRYLKAYVLRKLDNKE
jgi:hypothetical protein